MEVSAGWDGSVVAVVVAVAVVAVAVFSWAIAGTVARDRAVAAATAAVEIRFIGSLILLVEDPDLSMWALCPT